MKLATAFVLLCTVISDTFAKKLYTQHHPQVNADAITAQTDVLVTIADYQKNLVDKLLAMDASNAAILSLAIATLVFIIVQVIIVTKFLNLKAEEKKKPGVKYWTLLQDGIMTDSEIEFSVEQTL